MKKIFITGCAKTGTTLVNRLFNAFELNVCVLEIDYVAFIKSDYDVGKRTSQTLFSQILDKNTINQQLKVFENLNIINIVRNKEDVLRSDNRYVSKERYESSMEQAEKYKNYIAHTIHYEDLIADPDKEQQKINNLFNLVTLHKWSDYPNFIDIEKELEPGEEYCEGIYSLRPIGEKSPEAPLPTTGAYNFRKY